MGLGSSFGRLNWKRRKGSLGSIMIMNQARDGGKGGLKDCFAGGLQCGYSLSNFYLIWLHWFETKKFLGLVRRY